MAPPKGLMMAGCLTCVIVTVVTVILVAMGFSKLSVNEVGIDYSANSLTLNTKKLYSNGIYFLGVGHSFIKYPRRQLELNMEGRSNNIIARSRDGLKVTLEVKILYSLVIEIDALASLYLMFREDYTVPVKHISRSVIRDVASEFTGFQFWIERTNVSLAMENALRDRLNDVFVKVDTFLLSSYTLPSNYQAEIQLTEIQNQEMNKVVYELDQIEQKTQGLILQAEQTVKQIEATTIGEVEKINYEADAEIFKLENILSAENTGYGLIKSEMAFTEEELTSFIWLEELSQSTTPKIMSIQTPDKVKLG